MTQRLKTYVLAVLFGILIPMSALAAVTMEGMVLTSDPASAIRLTFSRKPIFKIVQIDSREVMVAIRSAVPANDLKRSGTGGDLIRDIEMNRLSGGDMALMIRTWPRLASVDGVWGDDGALRVRMKPVFAPKMSLKRKTKRALTASPSAPVTTDHQPPEQVGVPDPDRGDIPETLMAAPASEPSKPSTASGFLLAGIPRTLPSEKSGSVDALTTEFNGSFNDFIRIFDTAACGAHESLRKGLASCDKGKWADAQTLFAEYAETQLTGDCIDAAYYLRAFAGLQMLNQHGEDLSAGMAATEHILDALSLYPDSAYAPYGYAFLGKAYFSLKNYDRAQAYYRIVAEKYPELPMKPEMLYDGAQILEQADAVSKAEATYLEILKDYPNFPLKTQVKYKLGSLYFNEAEYRNALTYLTDVMAETPRRVFENGDLLFKIGTAYYQIGQSETARELLARAFNLFPDLPSKDIILSRIGDTYVDAGDIDRAIRVFQLVTEKYPGTDGFVISTMRLAQYVADVGKKKAYYRLIINEYPDNPLARLARFRLADVLNKNAEYAESIKTIKALIATDDRALLVEANFILQQASMAQFDLWLQDQKYPLVISRFEEDKEILNKAEFPELFLTVGQSYLEGHFYAQALDNYLKAYKRYPKGKRPPQLIRGMGVAMKEMQKYDDALKMLASYRRYFPKADDIPMIYSHEGDIHLAREALPKALWAYQKAVSIAADPADKAEFLEKEATALEASGSWQKAALRLKEAAELLYGLPDRAAEIAALQLRAARIYLGKNAYTDAAAALQSTLKLLGETPAAAEARYLLGGAYERIGELEAAMKAYQILVDTDDSLWAELARTRLKGISLDARMNPS
ncbi:MAG: hypothetical protein CSA22_02915 [Deltaproteobacteria bacterium]|nr:MAG: hypothetical protein CSA22_02915 [Deltaproteobacteria bacterium]